MTGSTHHHPEDEELVLYFYGEAQAGGVRAHVEQCAECQARVGEIERTLAAVDGHRIPARGEGYAAEVWARLQDRLEHPSPRHWLSWFTPRRLLLAGSMAVLLVAAFLVGRYSSPPPPKQIAGPAVVPPAVPAVAVPGQIRDRVLLVAVGDHLQRSQMVLVELMNRPADGAQDISTTQEWMRDLVPTNRLIRQTADEAGEPTFVDVLDDLERMLVEIANGPSHLSGAEFEQMRRRIEAQGLVFKIRVLDSQVRQRELTPAHAARTRT